eukprot:350388-Chlamydomonas_euryale.AAC.4
MRASSGMDANGQGARSLAFLEKETHRRFDDGHARRPPSPAFLQGAASGSPGACPPRMRAVQTVRAHVPLFIDKRERVVRVGRRPCTHRSHVPLARYTWRPALGGCYRGADKQPRRVALLHRSCAQRASSPVQRRAVVSQAGGCAVQAPRSCSCVPKGSTPWRSWRRDGA